MSISNFTTRPTPVRELNRYFWLEAGVLMEAPMYDDGTMKKNGSKRVTRLSVEEIGTINNRLGFKLTPADFLR